MNLFLQLSHIETQNFRFLANPNMFTTGKVQAADNQTLIPILIDEAFFS